MFELLIIKILFLPNLSLLAHTAMIMYIHVCKDKGKNKDIFHIMSLGHIPLQHSIF